MDQQPIREWNNQLFQKEEGAAIIKELNDRTKSDQTGYNSLEELATKVKELETVNAINTVIFKNQSNFINLQQEPITTPINISIVDGKNGAVACAYYRGATLEINDTENRIVMRSDGAFMPNELCLIWFLYDKGSGAIHITVQAGDTLNRPGAYDGTGEDKTPPSKMTIVSILDKTAPAQMEITSIT